MKNDERADKLLFEANNVFAQVQQSLGVENWNLTIRRAQEVVELVLKGLLAQLGIDTQKSMMLHRYSREVLREEGLWWTMNL
jgi:HEPN domain-containing protein